GRFSQQRYEQALRAQGMTPFTFEPTFRRALLIAQVRDGIATSAFATPREVEQFIRLLEQRRDLFYMKIPLSRYDARAKIDVAEVQTYYEQHKDRFMRPEEVALSYLDLDVGRIMRTIPVDEPALRNLYGQEAQRFVTPAERRVRHLLILVPKGADRKVVARARARAGKLLAEIRHGASFAKLAKEYSQDPGSAAKGGDLGFFAQGTMAPAFGKAVFAIKKVGEVVGPVRTSFGFHVIQLEAVRPAREIPFSKVKSELATEYRKRKAEDRYYNLVNRLTNLTYEHPNTLELAAKRLGLKVRRSGLFSRKGGRGIAARPKVVRAAFSPDVLGGNNSDPLELSPMRTVVIRVHEHKPAALKPLKEVRTEIERGLREAYAKEQARKLVQAILGKLHSGKSPGAVAKAERLELKRVRSATRRDASVDGAILRAAFTLGRPKQGRGRYTQIALVSGDYAVVGVTGVLDGDPEALPKKKRIEDRRVLARVYGQGEFLAFLSDLKRHAKIEIEQRQLNEP
ncbi:MAG TPA: peptidylprolyl isomerase, partial [Chromatiales bacterium]|nr:peptidylprolyl isomerase [Chromatiales bacterium]